MNLASPNSPSPASPTRARLQTRYNELWSQAIDKIRTGKIEIDSVLAARQADPRRGFTVIAQPSPSVNQAVQAFLDNLRSLEPDQHFYTPPELHITVLSLFTATVDRARFFARTTQYLAAVEAVARRTPPVEIEFAGVTASPGAIMIQGFLEDESLNDTRDALRASLRAQGLTEGIDARYRLETAHMTVARFRAPLRDSHRFSAALEQARRLTFGRSLADRFLLVKNDWYMTSGVLETVENYPLASCRPGQV